MPRISKAPEVRRQELLDAAAELFLRKGYEATSIRDILAVVDGQPGMFYYYFASKSEVFRAAMNGYVERYVREVTAIMGDANRPVSGRLNGALRLAATMLARFNIATDQGAMVESTGLLSANCLEFLERLVEPAAGLLCEIKPDTEQVEAYTVARFFLYGMFGLMHDAKRGGGEADLYATVEEAYPLAARLLELPVQLLRGENDA